MPGACRELSHVVSIRGDGRIVSVERAADRWEMTQAQDAMTADAPQRAAQRPFVPVKATFLLTLTVSFPKTPLSELTPSQYEHRKGFGETLARRMPTPLHPGGAPLRKYTKV